MNTEWKTLVYTKRHWSAHKSAETFQITLEEINAFESIAHVAHSSTLCKKIQRWFVIRTDRLTYYIYIVYLYSANKY